MIKEEKTRFIILLSSLTIVICTLVIWPYFQIIKKARQVISINEVDIQEKTYLLRKNRLQSTLDSIIQLQSEIENTNQAKRLLAISNACPYNLKLLRTSEEKAFTLNGHRGIKQMFQFEGSYHAIVYFLNEIRNQKSNNWVSKLHILKSANHSKDNLLIADIELSRSVSFLNTK